jgi:Leucine-rich repeat (LRR) protein
MCGLINQGLRGLRGLRVLRLAYNKLHSLEGLGHATQLEVLDVTGNRIKDLTGEQYALTGTHA